MGNLHSSCGGVARHFIYLASEYPAVFLVQDIRSVFSYWYRHKRVLFTWTIWQTKGNPSGTRAVIPIWTLNDVDPAAVEEPSPQLI
jgi:hypothetical protein